MKYLFLPIALGAAVLGYVARSNESSELESSTLTADAASVESAGYITLDSESEPFRSTFNADVDKTRILMLVAPT